MMMAEACTDPGRQPEQVGPRHVVILENGRDVVYEAYRHTMYAADILQHSFHLERGERSGREDLLPRIGVVPPLQILFDLLPAVGLEIAGTLSVAVANKGVHDLDLLRELFLCYIPDFHRRQFGRLNSKSRLSKRISSSVRSWSA